MVRRNAMPTISMFRGIKITMNWELARNRQELFEIEPLR
jgi:hypothetical protein